MEWAIKLLYIALNIICENIVNLEENWMGKIICNKNCKQVDDDDSNENFEDFMKRIKSEQLNNNDSDNTDFNKSKNNSYVDRDSRDRMKKLIDKIYLEQIMEVDNDTNDVEFTPHQIQGHINSVKKNSFTNPISNDMRNRSHLGLSDNSDKRIIFNRNNEINSFDNIPEPI